MTFESIADHGQKLTSPAGYLVPPLDLQYDKRVLVKSGAWHRDFDRQDQSDDQIKSSSASAGTLVNE